MNEFSQIPLQVSPWQCPPESCGFSSPKILKIRQLLAEAISEKMIPGAVVFLQQGSQLILHESRGWRNQEARQPQELDDIFSIASMSKAITSAGFLLLVEKGLCRLEDPLTKYLPYFKDRQVLHSFDQKSGKYQTKPCKKPLLIKHLLNHTAGIPYPFLDSRIRFISQARGGLDARKGLAQNVQKLAELPLIHEPGQGWTYGYGTDIIGHLIEVIAGQSLNDYLGEALFSPLQMPDSGFFLDPLKHSRMSWTYLKTASGLSPMKPYLADPQAHRFLSGGGGLVSTAEDYAHFLEMLLNKGFYNNKRILQETSIRQLTSNQIESLRIQEPKFPFLTGEDSFGFGLMVYEKSRFKARRVSEGSYGWVGSNHTWFWVDPHHQLFGILMTQLMPFPHSANVRLFEEVQRLTYEAFLD